MNNKIEIDTEDLKNLIEHISSFENLFLTIFSNYKEDSKWSERARAYIEEMRVLGVKLGGIDNVLCQIQKKYGIKVEGSD